MQKDKRTYLKIKDSSYERLNFPGNMTYDKRSEL